MRDELMEKLFNDFPILYGGRTLPTNMNLMSFGFGCGSGWYNILYRLSSTLTELTLQLPPEQQADYMALQARERGGVLRFTMARSTPEMRKAIIDACAESKRTCQDCGGEGCPREIVTGSGFERMSWTFTLCEQCHDQRELRRIEDEFNRPQEICEELEEGQEDRGSAGDPGYVWHRFD